MMIPTLSLCSHVPSLLVLKKTLLTVRNGQKLHSPHLMALGIHILSQSISSKITKRRCEQVLRTETSLILSAC